MNIQAQQQADSMKDHAHKKSQCTLVAESRMKFAGYELSQKIEAETPGCKTVEKMQQFTYIRRKHCLFLLSAVSGFDCSFKRTGKLITAGCHFISAPVAFQESDDFLCRSAFDEFCNCKEIAGTAAAENNVADDVMVFQLEMNFGRTDGRFGFIAE